MRASRRLGRRRHSVPAGRFALSVAVAARFATGIAAQSLPPALSFTAGQAEQGQTSYAEHCASCHGENLDDGAYAPPLKGADFRQKWGASTADVLFTYSATKMPPSRPGSLDDRTYAHLLAFVLRENGSRAGTRELPA